MRRHIVPIIICLALGVLITIAIAWWCATGDLYSGRTLENGAPEIDGQFMWRVTRRDTRTLTLLSIFQTNNPEAISQSIADQQSYSRRPSPDLLDTWGWVPIGPAQLDGKTYRMELVWGFGWPWRAMFHREYSVYDDVRRARCTVIGGISTAGQNFLYDYTQPHALPLVPIWPWFYVQTIILGGVFFALFTCAKTFQIKRRLQRGQCPECGYDLRGEFESGCSECGWRRLIA